MKKHLVKKREWLESCDHK